MSKIDIIVEVDGGLVSNVYASKKDMVTVGVLDWDNYKVGPNEEARAYFRELNEQTKTMTKVY